MKVTLISPLEDIQTYGLRVLSACLKKEGFETQIIFIPGNHNEAYSEDLLNKIAAQSAGSGLVGLSLMTHVFERAVQITGKLRSLGMPVVWGGIHPTIAPEECLKHTDIICRGEAEATIVELAKCIESGQGYDNIKGLWLNRGSEIIRNPVQGLIEDLNSIPAQDYDYETHYVLDGSDIRKMDARLMAKYSEGVYMTMATRDCPFVCTFCCNNAINKLLNKKGIRKRSVDDVIKELANVRDNLPFIKKIKLDDDAFFILPEREIKEFSQKYKEQIKIPLVITGAAPSTVTREKMAALVDAGLIAVRMGIQTGSEHTKQIYKRYHTNQQIGNAAKIFNEFKDKIEPPQYDVILDNPFETEDDVIETLRFVSGLPPPFTLSLFSLAFYSATELYELAEKEGMLNNKAYTHRFHNLNKTYLNGLFYLINRYATIGLRIPKVVISLLVNKKARRFKISNLAYQFLKLSVSPLRFGHYATVGLKDISIGDFSRIKRKVMTSLGAQASRTV